MMPDLICLRMNASIARVNYATVSMSFPPVEELCDAMAKVIEADLAVIAAERQTGGAR